MLKNTFMIDYLICHTFISEATQFISKLIKKYNHMHVIFNNITTKWLVVYRECSHSSDENLMFVMCSGVARRATWAAAPRFHGFNIESEFLSLVLHGLKTAESRNNLIVANLVLRKQSWVAIFCKTPPNPLDKEATREHEHGMVKVVECLQGVHGFKSKADCQWAGFLETYWVPGAIGHSILRPEDPILTSHSHHWVRPEHAGPRRLFSCWCSQMNFLKTPLSGKLVSAQLLPPPPLENDPTPFTKTVH